MDWTSHDPVAQGETDRGQVAWRGVPSGKHGVASVARLAFLGPVARQQGGRGPPLPSPTPTAPWSPSMSPPFRLPVPTIWPLRDSSTKHLLQEPTSHIPVLYLCLKCEFSSTAMCNKCTDSIETLQFFKSGHFQCFLLFRVVLLTTK